MKKIILKFLQIDTVTSTEVDIEHALKVATATLLIETVRADFIVEESELNQLKQLLQEQFELTDEELLALVELAQQDADRMVSLQHITRLMNEHYDHAMKVKIVEMMWTVIYADGDKDHYEEHLVRQVAELLYLSHGEFIQARHRVEERQ
jgi:uncharacterized tellurite resistance protein B-like protein